MPPKLFSGLLAPPVLPPQCYQKWYFSRSTDYVFSLLRPVSGILEPRGPHQLLGHNLHFASMSLWGSSPSVWNPGLLPTWHTFPEKLTSASPLGNGVHHPSSDSFLLPRCFPLDLIHLLLSFLSPQMECLGALGLSSGLGTWQ